MQQANPMPGALLRKDIAYAGFWRRLLAYLIDLLLISAVGVTLGTLVITLAPDNRLALANVPAVTSAIGWAYYVLFETSPARGTLGKIALNLFVADVHGDPISYPRAAFRYFFKAFSTLLLGLGWIMAAFTPRKQALHDLMAGTLVLRRVTYLVIGQEPPTEPGDYWDGGRWVASVRPTERS
ncbi:MAG: RDD family protein [Chloroflexi bacterium]|nr:MAG: RDD family protein [Chloroflexota bacterium]